MLRRILLATVMIASVALSGAAWAAGDNGAGVLVDVDAFDQPSVTVRKKVFRVTNQSEILDVDGNPMKLHELEAHLGDWVFYRGSGGRHGGVLEVIQLAPDDE